MRAGSFLGTEYIILRDYEEIPNSIMGMGFHFGIDLSDGFVLLKNNPRGLTRKVWEKLVGLRE